MMVRLGVGAACAVLAALASRRLGWLDPGGAWTAALVGTAVFGFTGWAGSVPLLAFFSTSSLLGRLPARPGGRVHQARSARQVLANGGVAALAAMIYALSGQRWALGALVGSLAAANADTWSTELGMRSRQAPRHLWLGPRVPAGTSGGATLAGLLAGVAGALLIVVCGYVAHVPWWAPLIGGVGGTAVDTLAGGTLQVQYCCAACGRTIEAARHACPGPVAVVRGWAWLENDAVNLLATVVGGVAAAVLIR